MRDIGLIVAFAVMLVYGYRLMARFDLWIQSERFEPTDEKEGIANHSDKSI